MIKKSDEHAILRALPYVIWPAALILLLIEETKKKSERDKDLRHHSYNALGFAGGAILLWLPVIILSWIPVLGGIITALYGVTVIVLAVVFAVRAYNNDAVIVPVTTEYLKKNVKDF